MYVTISDLVIGYGERPILDPISFTLPSGCACLVIGPNGAGKSTLLRTIVGLQRALAGRVLIDEFLISTGALTELVPKGLRFLGQGDRGFKLLRLRDHRRVLSQLYLLRPNSAVDLDNSGRRIGLMSLGQRRLEAMRLLDCEPAKLFVLDEPTSGLDPDNRLMVKRWMKTQVEQRKSILAVEHDYRFFAEVFDKLIVIRARKLIYSGNMLATEQISDLLS